MGGGGEVWDGEGWSGDVWDGEGWSGVGWGGWLVEILSNLSNYSPSIAPDSYLILGRSWVGLG